MEENEVISADNTEVSADPQIDTDTTGEPTTNEVQEGEVADIKTEPSETKAYSDRLNAHAQKKIDEEYDKLYGVEYGIHSKAEYEKAIADQQAEAENQKFEEEHGINPNDIKPLFEQWKKSDPDFQELASSRAEKAVNTALIDLNNELKDAGLDLQLKDLSPTEVQKLDNVDAILDLVQNRKFSLAEAYFQANKKTIIGKQAIKAQQDTIKKLSANSVSSPGSLVSATQEETFFTKAQVDKMSKEDVLKNYDQIIKSTKKW